MAKVLTTTLDQMSYNFMVAEAMRRNVTKKKVLEDALKFYKKVRLVQEVEEWLQERFGEYSSIAKEFSDIQFSSLNE